MYLQEGSVPHVCVCVRDMGGLACNFVTWITKLIFTWLTKLSCIDYICEIVLIHLQSLCNWGSSYWKSTESLHKNIERHTAHTIVSWPNTKQWVIVHTYDLMMIIKQSIYIYIFSQSPQGKWTNWKHTAPHIVHTSHLMMIIKQSIYIYIFSQSPQREMDKLKTHNPTYCKMDDWENMLNLTHSTK